MDEYCFATIINVDKASQSILDNKLLKSNHFSPRQWNKEIVVGNRYHPSTATTWKKTLVHLSQNWIRYSQISPALMMTSSDGNIFRVTGPLYGEFTGPRCLTKASDAELWCMFSLICVWINGWVNNREAGENRRNLAHYDVTVMWQGYKKKSKSKSKKTLFQVGTIKTMKH